MSLFLELTQLLWFCCVTAGLSVQVACLMRLALKDPQSVDMSPRKSNVYTRSQLTCRHVSLMSTPES